MTAGKGRSASLDDLIALNEEIAALAAAGIPLERSLAQFGRDLPGTSGKLASRLAKRLEQGRTLSQAIEDEGDALPPVYRATVLAGLRSDDLPGALAALTDTARRVAETRRIVGMAAFYPALVVMVAWLLVAFSVAVILPSFDWLDLAGRGLMPLLKAGRESVRWWAPLVPVLLLVAAAVWWFRSGRAHAVGLGRSSLLRFPTYGSVRSLGKAANLAEVLALLVGRETPLDESLPLAAGAAGVASWQKASATLAKQTQLGNRLPDAPDAMRQLPPLVRLALMRPGGPEKIAAGLHQAATTYRDRARRGAEWLAAVLPPLLTVAIGGTAVAVYAAIIFWPYVSTLYEVGGWY